MYSRVRMPSPHSPRRCLRQHRAVGLPPRRTNSLHVSHARGRSPAARQDFIRGQVFESRYRAFRKRSLAFKVASGCLGCGRGIGRTRQAPAPWYFGQCRLRLRYRGSVCVRGPFSQRGHRWLTRPSAVKADMTAIGGTPRRAVIAENVRDFVQRPNHVMRPAAWLSFYRLLLAAELIKRTCYRW